VYLIARRRELNDLEKWAKEEFENMKKADIWSLAVVVNPPPNPRGIATLC
jgi:hypothetical protein